MSHGIDAVPCLREDCCDGRTDIDAPCISLIDGPGNDPRDLQDALNFIDEVVAVGQNSCPLPRQAVAQCRRRSAAPMRSRGVPVQIALALIASKREVDLSPGIDDLLTRR